MIVNVDLPEEALVHPPAPETTRYETARGPSAREHRDAWSWTVRQPAVSKLGNIRLAEWNDEGHVLAVTTCGLFLWNGHDWCAVNQKLDPLAIRFVRSAGSGRWVIGARDIWLYARGEMSLLWEPRKLNVECFDGLLDQVALVGGRDANGIATVQGCVRGHWLRPVSLTDVVSLTSLSRIDEDRWIVTGQTNTNEPFAAIVAPLALRMKRLRTDSVNSFMTSAGRPEIGVGCAVGCGGVLLCDRVASATETVTADLSAVAIDPVGRIVVAKRGRIWLRHGAPTPGWSVVWVDHSAQRPIVSLYADARVILALTNDATILEGRLGPAITYQASTLRDIGEDDDEATKPTTLRLKRRRAAS